MVDAVHVGDRGLRRTRRDHERLVSHGCSHVIRVDPANTVGTKELLDRLRTDS
jgi:hypothetical protein